MRKLTVELDLDKLGNNLSLTFDAVVDAFYDSDTSISKGGLVTFNSRHVGSWSVVVDPVNVRVQAIGKSNV